MGRVIGLLLLLNAVVLVGGLSLEWLGSQPSASDGFNADQVKLLGRVDPALVVARTALPAEPTAAAAPSPRCLSWSTLDEDLLNKLAERMQAAGIDPSDYDIHLEERLGWWVYLPPFADAATMQAAIAAAKQKGVKDIAPVRAGNMQNAVSLGAFPTLATAREQKVMLDKLGVQGLLLGPRPNSGRAHLMISKDVPEAKLRTLGVNWEPAAQACTEVKP